MTGKRIIDWVCALVVISLIGLWPILLFIAGVAFLLWVVRGVLIAWVLLAMGLRAASFAVWDRVIRS